MLKKFSSLLQVLFISAIVAFWQMLLYFKEEADTYFVMNIGRYVLEHGIPHVDPFTIHENLQLVAQQWLSGVIFWEAYKNFGVNGLLVIDFIMGVAMLFVYWRTCLLISDGNKILAFSMTFVIGLVTFPAIVPRPHLLSTPLFATEVFLLEKFTRTDNAKFLLPLLPISVLIINLHAAVWLMTLVLCLPFFFVRNVRHAKFLLATMVVMFLCGFINPYGFEAMTYVFRSYGLEIINDNIPEMFTPSAHNFVGKIFYLTEALVIFFLAKSKVPWRYIFLSGGIIFMAVMHSRNSLIFYLIATLPIAYAWKNLTLEKFFQGKILPKLMLLLPLSINTLMITMTLSDNSFQKLNLPFQILFAVTLLFIMYTLLVVRVEGRILHPQVLPHKIFSLFITGVITLGIYSTSLNESNNKGDGIYTQAIKFLLSTERPENIALYAPQGIGGLAGSFGIRYYIDSRTEVFIKSNNGQKDIFKEYVDLYNGKIYYKDFFNRYKFTHIIITSNQQLFIFDQLSRDKDFRVIYESERVEGYDVIRCKIFVPKVID